MSKFPQVLLLGNGLNLSCNGIKWDKLISDLRCNPGVDKTLLESLPYPLQVVLATKDTVNASIRKNLELFCGVEDIGMISEQIQQLLDIGFNDILTTNYSYEIERVAVPKVRRDGKYCEKLSRHTDAVKQAEPKYMLHTYNEISYYGKTNRVWHIHGELRKPDSIILGHYFYGILLGKYQEELASRKNEQYRRQQEQREPLMLSWLDSFIMGDVYVLGFGYDFSEMDMWWLLNRKKRENADHGKLYFYSPDTKEQQVAALIETYGGKAIDLGYCSPNPNYKEFYRTAISDIKEKVENRRKENLHV